MVAKVHTCLMHTTLAAKNAHTPAQACLCDGAATSLPWNPLQSWILGSAQETMTIKIHSWRGRGCVDSDAQASSHQSCWCGTYPVSRWLTLAVPGCGPDPSQISIFAHLLAKKTSVVAFYDDLNLGIFCKHVHTFNYFSLLQRQTRPVSRGPRFTLTSAGATRSAATPLLTGRARHLFVRGLWDTLTVHLAIHTYTYVRIYMHVYICIYQYRYVYTFIWTFIDIYMMMWLLLLPLTVGWYLWLRVYVVQIHGTLSSRVLDGLEIEPTTQGLTVPRSDQLIYICIS